MTVTWSHDLRDGLPTVTVAGVLTAASGDSLFDATVGVLRQRSALLIDLSRLAVAGDGAVTVFARIVAEALRWPDVLLVVCAPTAEVMRQLDDDRIHPRLVFASVAAGRSAALATPAPPVTEVLLPVAGAARRARAVVTDACLRWREPGVAGPAASVVSELVTNVAVHAHTMMTLQVRLRLCHVRIAVFDGSAAPAVLRPAGPDGVAGRGLHLVDAFSAAWGSAALPTGKVVWSALARSGR